ncbi:hypothetical protein AC579_1692 [Pseudocercospora musae]|uniref:Arginine biosynthesis bifunctional protein ArgJ, mitochondrial n=1 Tax=Pseudocercospora musae TaxID=113226 RepID=A0A139I4U8_9PEZI|nr:hypothetical protein AC579_1692 [Pseudocercospora musae]
MPPKRTIANRLLAGLVHIRHYSAPADRSIPAAKQKYLPTSGTYPKGFLAGSAFAGVKASNTKYHDLALVMSETPCPATATFTKNIFKAAPVAISKHFLAARGSEGFRGVLVNSGCANAVTGSLGLDHATTMARETDKLFNPTASDDAVPQTLVMSTGVIGQRLPIRKITAAIPKLKENVGNTHEHWLNAAKAICTTDTFPKLLSRTFTLPSHPDTTYSIAGMTKGAGMIHPNMATLLGIICTDVKIDPASMRTLLVRAVNKSFNCISIDGDTSTNDTVAFFANGAAAPEDVKPLYYSPMDERDDSGPRVRIRANSDLLALERVLTGFAQDLAKLVVRDGEGATKFVTIRVKSDTTHDNAKRAAVSIARSALVKTALYGKDANWGRILCAIGYAPGIMDSREIRLADLRLARITRQPEKEDSIKAERAVIPKRTSVSFIPADGSEELKLLVRGEPEQVDEERAKQILEMEDLEILVRLEDDGKSAEPKRVTEAVFWTCDFSHEYVTINGDYRTLLICATLALHVATHTSTMTQSTQNTLRVSEDDIYRTSSQFRLWSFSPEQLAAQRRKTHELALARAKQYLSQQNGAATNGHTNIEECLTENEELRLVQRYGEIIRLTATQLKWPTHIAITAIQYLKRFYLSNSCVTYPPKEIYKTVMFLASKTEAFHLPLSQFSRSVSSEPDTVLAPEYKVMQALRFTLDVRQPSRGLKGTLMELLNMVEGMIGPVPGVEETDGKAIQQRLFELKAPEDGNKTQWRAKGSEADMKQARDRVQLAFQSAKELLESTASLTDAYLLYTPSQMVMAALEIADAPLFHFYLDTKLPSSSPIRAKILCTVHSCAELLAAYDPESSMSKEERAELEKKLEACRDPNTRDLVKVHAAVKRNGAEEGMVSEQDAKRRKLEREKSNKEMDDLFGPSLPMAKG